MDAVVCAEEPSFTCRHYVALWKDLNEPHRGGMFIDTGNHTHYSPIGAICCDEEDNLKNKLEYFEII